MINLQKINWSTQPKEKNVQKALIDIFVNLSFIALSTLWYIDFLEVDNFFWYPLELLHLIQTALGTTL